MKIIYYIIFFFWYLLSLLPLSVLYLANRMLPEEEVRLRF